MKEKLTDTTLIKTIITCHTSDNVEEMAEIEKLKRPIASSETELVMKKLYTSRLLQSPYYPDTKPRHIIKKIIGQNSQNTSKTDSTVH